MKNVIILLFFVTTFCACNTSYSGDTTCTVEILHKNELGIFTPVNKNAYKLEVNIRKGDVEDFREGQDVWLYQYYNTAEGKASEWRVIKNNRYGTDTTVIEEVVPNYGAKTSTYKKAKLVKL